MGHLPLPSSSTATVKRRRPRARERRGEETYPTARAIPRNARSSPSAGNTPFLGQLFLHRVTFCFCRSSSAASSSSSTNFFAGIFLLLFSLFRSPPLADDFAGGSRPTGRRGVLEAKDTARVLTRIAGGNEDSAAENEIEGLAPERTRRRRREVSFRASVRVRFCDREDDEENEPAEICTVDRVQCVRRRTFERRRALYRPDASSRPTFGTGTIDNARRLISGVVRARVGRGR